MVDILLVARMVNAVVRWRREDVLQEAQFTNQSAVCYKLESSHKQYR